MYLQGSVHGIGVRFLIDTGATVTMIAKGGYERMAPGDRPRLYEVTGNVLCADGKTARSSRKRKIYLIIRGKTPRALRYRCKYRFDSRRRVRIGLPRKSRKRD
ncbi:hypothetical protein ACJMK2_035869 [Sinanodonta woodiana]|uniref:Peptidase A2 domain-containing protein n=1 Tax=Sinanodonta woodiana TaxID=1069815 RepID=A0ABD3WFF1_SINWO